MTKLEIAAKEYADGFKTFASLEGLENISGDFINGAKWAETNLFESLYKERLLKAKAQLLKNILDNFNDVHSEYHFEILERYLDDLKNPRPITSSEKAHLDAMRILKGVKDA